MAKLSLVTFISGIEVLTDDYLSLADNLQKFYDVEVVAFVDHLQVNENLSVRQIVSPDTTKYARILQLLLQKRGDYFLCIDNDVTPELNAVLLFLQESFQAQADLSWGRIGVSSTVGIITKMIKIDKMLSHRIIRPLLWHFGWGASIPGQLFLLKTEAFQDRLSMKDTVFDDLTIGICAREHDCKVYFNQSILGWERPKSTLISLLRQRIRWAKGFSQVVIANFEYSKKLRLVLLHGAAYHLLWVVFWGLIYISAFINIKLAFILWITLVWILTFNNRSLIFSALLYTILFPVIHIVWLIVVLLNMSSFFLTAFSTTRSTKYSKIRGADRHVRKY